LANSTDQGKKMLLAHWTYTREEWKAFVKWKLMKKGIAHYLAHLLRIKSYKYIPEIKISSESVWFNENHEPFHEGNKRFRKIDIHDAGKLNVMEISYYHPEKKGGSSEIRIPIPKGRLREAIRVQEALAGMGLWFDPDTKLRR
jgi:hypothetical protein